MSHAAIRSSLEDKKMPWMALLDEALNAPGTLSQAYGLFHRFSMCNQMLAWSQLPSELRGPLKTFKGWQELGRNVRKGEKAIALYMPFSIKPKAEQGVDEKEKENDTVGKKKAKASKSRTSFMLRNNWFSLAQTDGEQEPTFDPPPEWSVERALDVLGVTRVNFELANGNVQGYAVFKGRKVAISPLCEHPLRTLFHELAHLDLHALGDPLAPHGQRPPDDVREVEAETVAYLVADALGVEMDSDAIEKSRGYIQNCMQDTAARAEFAKTRASRVFGCAQRIIAAGKPAKETKASV